MLDALQALRYISAGLWPLLLQCLCLLLQDRQPHGDVKPIDQMLAKRMQILLNPADILTAIWGPSVWQAHRFHRGFGTSTRPNNVLTEVLPESLLVYRLRQSGHARRCSRSSRTCWATTKSCTHANSVLLSLKFMPSVSIASSRRSIVRTCRRCSLPSAFRQTTSTRTFMAATSSTVPTHSNARWPLSD